MTMLVDSLVAMTMLVDSLEDRRGAQHGDFYGGGSL